MDTKTVFAVLFLLSQLVLPLRYYLQDGGDYAKYDERFAWRMFSPVRMVRCSGEFRQDGVAKPLSQNYHMTWSTLFKRGRPDVLQGIADDLCADEGVKEVTLTFQCREADKTVVKLEDGSENLCATEGNFQ